MLKRTFDFDVFVCVWCGGRRRVLAYVTTHSPMLLPALERHEFVMLRLERGTAHRPRGDRRGHRARARSPTRFDGRDYEEELRRELSLETDYLLEAKRARAFRELLAPEADLLAPEPIPERSSSRVLCLTRMPRALSTSHEFYVWCAQPAWPEPKREHRCSPLLPS